MKSVILIPHRTGMIVIPNGRGGKLSKEDLPMVGGILLGVMLVFGASLWWIAR